MTARVQKRQPRRLLEAPPAFWKRWDRWAKLEGLSWAAFTRRALEQRGASINDLVSMSKEEPALLQRLPGLSEKPASKNGAATAQKKRAALPRGKGSSRS